jgi:hypothetical protein
MKVVAIRDSVHASDEPEPFQFDIAKNTPPMDLLRRAVDRTWLPSIQGDRATWSIASNNLLAVVAYEWPDVKLLPFIEEHMKTADWRKDVLWLYFNYHAQIDPELVYKLFWGTRLHA